MELLIWIGAGLGGAVLLAVLAELGLRFWLRHMARSWAFFPHSKIEMTIAPGICSYLPDRTVAYEINEDGERAGPVPNAARLYRVLVVGGSAAECRLLNRDETWAGVLQRELNQPEILRSLGCDAAHVGQIAMAQMDCRSLLQVLEAVLPSYNKLDLIIVMNGASDPLRWLEAGAPSGGVAKQSNIDEFLASHSRKRYTWRSPALVHHLAKRLKARFVVDRQLNVGRTIVKEGAARNAVTDFYRLESDPGAMLDLYETMFRKVLARSKQAAARLLVVRQPWMDRYEFSPEDERELWSGRVGRYKDPGPPKFLSHRDLMKYMRLMDERAARASAAEGVECISVMDVLPHRLGIFYDHFHFTKEGAAIVGRTVFAAVLAPCGAAK